MRMLRQEGFVIYFLPLKPLAILRIRCRIRRGMTYSWETKVLQVKITNKVKLAVYKILELFFAYLVVNHKPS